jgi:GNAT superfamily N-acetyltransferase
MNIQDFRLVRLTQEFVIKPFDCGDTDLNDFLFNDSKKYQEELLAVTYILESDTDTVAFFSLLNDKINFEIDARNNKSFWNRFNRNIPNQKRSRSYPAMKIGRLAVNDSYKGQNIGRFVLDYLKELFIENNRTGCKFITVDGYRASLKFYEKNDFKYLTTEDEFEDTRLMFFNLSDML